GAGLQEELFGPATLFIECSTVEDFHLAVGQFGGQLGASLHGTAGELEGEEARRLLAELSGISGRVLINGFPTGLEDCDSLQHGGPYPATTDSHWTSVGTAAIERFGRPVAYQGVADSLLPEPLRESNPLGLRRLVDGRHEAAGDDGTDG
ncbi:MAG: aldehyde dehydrogenase (NADP(+)), partial [Verrucomicrobiales bacterium]